MKRSRIDSRIELWNENYINNRQIRLPEDRDAQIEQIEHVSDITYIVEVWNPKDDEEDGCR